MSDATANALVTFRMPTADYRRLQALARTQGRTVAAELRLLIERHLDGQLSVDMKVLAEERVAALGLPSSADAPARRVPGLQNDKVPRVQRGVR